MSVAFCSLYNTFKLYDYIDVKVSFCINKLQTSLDIEVKDYIYNIDFEMM